MQLPDYYKLSYIFKYMSHFHPSFPQFFLSLILPCSDFKKISQLIKGRSVKETGRGGRQSASKVLAVK